jgi:Domain of unknown function (DUF1877)
MGLLCTLHAVNDETLQNGELYESLELDKAWHGLHFLLSGSASQGAEPSQFLLSGTLLPEVSEQVAVHRHSAVEAFSKFLQSVSNDVLAARYDPRRMQELEIYPEIWTDEEGLSFILRLVDPLRAFIARHASLGHAMLVVIA